MLYINEFLTHLKNKGLKPVSIYQYKYLLNYAKTFFKSIGRFDDRNITERDCLLLKKLNQSNNEAAWLKERVVLHLRVYFRYVEKMRYIIFSPLNDIVNQRIHNKRTPIYTELEIKNIFEKIGDRFDIDIRNKVMLEICYSSALRPSEICRLKMSDIDFENRVIFIRKSKKGKDRVVPIGKRALASTSAYLQIRGKRDKGKGEGYFFISHMKGTPLTYGGFIQSLEHTCARYGITQMQPSSIRPSTATHLLKNGMGIMHIKELLGHENIETTKVYLRVNTISLVDKLKEKHPRNNMK